MTNHDRRVARALLGSTRLRSVFVLVAALAVAACTTGATLRKEVGVMERQLDRAWRQGAYRCAPRELAQAEAEVVFVRAELDQGNPVRAARHRTRARDAMKTVLAQVKTCPTLLPDTDGDGLFDPDDQCPTQPEDFDDRDDADGCPDFDDRDGDTVLDPDDACPGQPGPVENRGCPYGDTDGDGLNDDVDACPKAVEDIDQFEDADGCPDPDNDKDGIPDEGDQCPLEAEVVNGFEDDDGCPDVDTQLVKVNRAVGKIELKQKVYFASGRARIRSQSHALLDEVAEVLKANSTMTVLIEGHTDSVGSNSVNLQLSQRRADAVRTYLIERQIEPDRLTAIGFGEEKPIDSNRTRRGRERNRRVDFTITNQ